MGGGGAGVGATSPPERPRPTGGQARATPGPGKEAGLFSTTSWSTPLAPAAGRGDRWALKEGTVSGVAVACRAGVGGWGAFGARARSPSGVWEPGPQQHPGLVLVTKDGKVQVTCNCLAGQPASPRGRPAGRGLFQASVSPASRHRAGGLVAGLRSPVGRRGRKEGVSGPGFRARLAK